eukprot:COSAG02_NODE_79_length_40228_cov_18.435762_28_plen_42_part_00
MLNRTREGLVVTRIHVSYILTCIHITQRYRSFFARFDGCSY